MTKVNQFIERPYGKLQTVFLPNFRFHIKDLPERMIFQQRRSKLKKKSHRVPFLSNLVYRVDIEVDLLT